MGFAKSSSLPAGKLFHVITGNPEGTRERRGRGFFFLVPLCLTCQAEGHTFSSTPSLQRLASGTASSCNCATAKSVQWPASSSGIFSGSIWSHENIASKASLCEHILLGNSGDSCPQEHTSWHTPGGMPPPHAEAL